MNFADRLSALMEGKPVSNYRLAIILGVGESAIRQWRKGISLPRQKNLEALAEFFNVHPAWLLYGEKEYAPTPRDRALQMTEQLERYITNHPDQEGWIIQMINVLTKEGREGFREPPTVHKKGKKKKPAA